MPVYKRSYRPFSSSRTQRMRWLLVAQFELRALSKAWLYRGILLLGGLHILVRILQVVAFDIIAQDPNHPLALVITRMQFMMVGEQMLFDFIRLQGPLMLLLFLYAGSGMICNDLRNNLLPLLFSKPMRWHDYLLGKLAALLALGLGLTAAPAVVFVAIHAMLAPGAESLLELSYWSAASVLFSLLMVLPAALGVLAGSAVLPGQNLTAIAVFMLLIANTTLSVILVGSLDEPGYLLVSFPVTVSRIGQKLFGAREFMFDVHIGWSLLYVGVVLGIFTAVLVRRVHRAEVAA